MSRKVAARAQAGGNAHPNDLKKHMVIATESGLAVAPEPVSFRSAIVNAAGTNVAQKTLLKLGGDRS